MNDGTFLVIDRVSKRFNSAAGEAIAVIEELSITIAAGELIVFLGPSGCGKTTLMRIVGGLEQQSAGTVLLDGSATHKPDRRRGMVFQSYSSFPWLTVRQNIDFGLRYRTDLSAADKADIAQRYLRLVGLQAFADYYPNKLSGGMRQRVAIARTLAADPEVLLMDEPFGALDAQTREFLQFQLLRLHRAARKTTIFVTHDVEEAVLLADRIIVFSARPARIIDEIRVAAHFSAERDPAIKENPVFFQLRNRVLKTVREQAQLMSPEAA